MTKNPKSLQELAAKSFRRSFSYEGITKSIVVTCASTDVEEDVQDLIHFLKNIEKEYQKYRDAKTSPIPSAIRDLLKSTLDEESIYQKLSKGEGSKNIFDYILKNIADDDIASKLIEYFISKGCEVKTNHNTGEVPLHEATRKGMVKSMEKIIEQKPRFVNTKSDDIGDEPPIPGDVPLDLAIENFEAISLLIAKGADIDRVKLRSKTAINNLIDGDKLQKLFLTSCRAGNVSAVEFLIGRVCDEGYEELLQEALFATCEAIQGCAIDEARKLFTITNLLINKKADLIKKPDSKEAPADFLVNFTQDDVGVVLIAEFPVIRQICDLYKITSQQEQDLARQEQELTLLREELSKKLARSVDIAKVEEKPGATPRIQIEPFPECLFKGKEYANSR